MSQTRDNVAIYVEELVDKMRGPTPAPSKPTIFEVDDHLRKVNEKDYEPQIVSIGPIHHGKDHVKSMEQHKVRFLDQLLQKRPDLSIDKIVEELRGMEGEARQSYSNSLNLDRDKFVGILLLDGCFVVEVIRMYFFNKATDKDAIFASETISQITRDLMLFENQLPLVVLRHLFDMIKTEDPEDNLRRRILFLVQDMLPWLEVSKYDPSLHTQLDPPNHLLGLVYQCFLPFSTKTSSGPEGLEGNESPVHINSASELKEDGIRFKRSGDHSLVFAARVLKLPPLQVSGQTESLLRNVMAYEQLQLDDHHTKHVTDYTFFMHCLIRSTKDIEILRRSGIISNYLGGDVMILQMFDRLGTNFMRSSEFCYASVFESLNRHCGRRHKRWMAKLRRNYFNSPWSLVKFLAATLLLLLTVVQAVFSVLSFTNRRT